MKKSTVVFDMHLTIFRPLSQEEANLVNLAKDDLPIKPMPQAIETFLGFYQLDYKVVIISSADTQSSRERLDYLLHKYGLEEALIKQIFKDIDILSMMFFGSKNTKEAWVQAMQPYSNIEYVFEDSEAKLHAAGEAAKELGSEPELYTSIVEYTES